MFFASALMGVWLSGVFIRSAVDVAGVEFPSRVITPLPAATLFLLDHLPGLPMLLWAVAGAAIVGALLIVRLVPAPADRLHGVALVSLCVYHLLLMLWVFFVTAFLVLPYAKAGI